MKLVNMRVIVLRLMLGIEAPSCVEFQSGRLLLVRRRILWNLTLLVNPYKRVGAKSFDANHSAQRVGSFPSLFARAKC